MVHLDVHTLMVPMGAVRILEVLLSCVSFSVAASAGHNTTSYWAWCMFTWGFCCFTTLLILVLELTRLSAKVPISWDDFTTAFAMLATLMVLAASIIYPTLFAAAADDLPQPTLPPIATTDLPQTTATDLPRPIVTNNPQRPIATTDLLQTIAATDIPRPIVTTNLPKPIPTTNLPQPIPTTNLPQPILTTNVPQPILTTNVPKPIATTNVPQTIVTTNVPQRIAAADLRQAKAATDLARPIAATVMSFLCFLAYAAEVGITRFRPGEVSGFLSTVPGLLKVLEAFVACIIFICLDPGCYPGFGGLQWCVAVYSLCFIFALLIILLTISRQLAVFPFAFDKVLTGYNILAVLMYMTAVVVWPLYAFQGNCDRSWDGLVVVSFMTCVNLVVYIVDTVYSVRLVFFVTPD